MVSNLTDAKPQAVSVDRNVGEPLPPLFAVSSPIGLCLLQASRMVKTVISGRELMFLRLPYAIPRVTYRCLPWPREYLPA